MTIKEKIYRFMMGRYGIDELYVFLMIIDVVLGVINAFLSSFLISLLVFLTVIYALFRVFSRNVSKRQAENRKFLNIKWKIGSFFSSIFKSKKTSDKKTHVFRICPSCKAKIRLPRKKGPHKVRCPRCQVLFDVHIR